MRRLSRWTLPGWIFVLALSTGLAQQPPSEDKPVVVPPAPPRPGTSAPQPDRQPTPPVPAQEPVRRLPDLAPRDDSSGNQASATIVAGTPIPVRVVRYLDSDRNRSGDTFEALLDEDIMAGDRVLIPEGTMVIGRLENVLRGGRVSGRAEMTLTLQEIELRSGIVPIQSNEITVKAGSSKGKDARTVAIASGVGAVLGAIFGGKKGAVIGAGTGAGAGTGRVMTTRGKEARVEREQLLTFQLEEDVRVSIR